MEKSLLVSVRADLAKKIISGEKSWEMRKSCPKKVDYLIIYAKKPIGLAIGYATVNRIRSFAMRSDSKIWVDGFGCIAMEDFLSRVQISEKEFLNYFKDYQKTLIEIGGGIIGVNAPISMIDNPVKLPFHPPQQWRYFDGHPEEILKTWEL